ncbi:MAG: zf-HC2 domain-containing protein [bacterium]|nr:zf-HC2 domain-containing protein [bacterium]
MTCDDVQQHIHRFLDTELPPPMLLAVARHAGGCSACETRIRELSDLGDALRAEAEAALATLDMTQVWAGVAKGLDAHDAEVTRRRRLRALPLWGSGLAAAAVLVALLDGPRPDVQMTTSHVVQQQPVRQVAAIDRLAVENRHQVSVRRDQKGFTLIALGDGNEAR